MLIFLIWPTEREYDISSILYSIKKPVTNWALSYVRNEAPTFLKRMEDRQPSGELHHRFWQRDGGYDRNVVEPETVLMQIEYLHLNRVRRGLCEVPEDWFWSSAADYAGVRVGVIDHQPGIAAENRPPLTCWTFVGSFKDTCRRKAVGMVPGNQRCISQMIGGCCDVGNNSGAN